MERIQLAISWPSKIRMDLDGLFGNLQGLGLISLEGGCCSVSRFLPLSEHCSFLLTYNL